MTIALQIIGTLVVCAVVFRAIGNAFANGYRMALDHVEEEGGARRTSHWRGALSAGDLRAPSRRGLERRPDLDP